MTFIAIDVWISILQICTKNIQWTHLSLKQSQNIAHPRTRHKNDPITPAGYDLLIAGEWEKASTKYVRTMSSPVLNPHLKQNYCNSKSILKFPEAIFPYFQSQTHLVCCFERIRDDKFVIIWARKNVISFLIPCDWIDTSIVNGQRLVICETLNKIRVIWNQAPTNIHGSLKNVDPFAFYLC